MKKVIGIGCLVLACAAFVRAESQTVTLTATNGQTVYSAAIPVHGVIDKVEYVKTGNSQADIVVASYDGTTALDTFVTKQNLAAGTQTGVVRPRFIGTTSAGVNVAAVTASDGAAVTNGFVSTILTAAYEAPMAGGNVKVQLVNDESTNVTATVTVYFKPVQR